MIFRSVTVDGESKERLDWTIAEISSGHSVTVSFSVTVNPLTEEDGAILLKNVALYKVPDSTVPEEPEDPNNPDGPFDPSNPVEHQVSSFIKYSDPAGGSTAENAPIIKIGEAISYTLQLNSEATQQGVIVSDTLPIGLSLATGSITYTMADGTVVQVPDSAFNSATNTITWPTIDVQAGITKFEFSAVIDNLPQDVYARLFTNKAVLEYTDGTKEPTESNEVTHKTNFGESSLHKTAATILVDKNGNETVDVAGAGTATSPIVTAKGQIVEYKLTIDRTADEENRSGDIRVTDIIPDGTIFIPNSIKGEILNPISNSEATIKSMEYTTVTDTDGKEKPAVVYVVSGLANGEKAELTFRVTAPTETDNPSTPEYESGRVYTNTAKLVDEEFDNTTDSETTYHQIQAPVLEALKTSNLQVGAKVEQGDVITYSIQLKNIGQGTAENVIIKDIIPEFTTYVTGSARSSKTNTTNTFGLVDNQETLIWIVETLESGETVTVSFQVTVDNMQQDGTREIKNTAQIKIPLPGENPEEVARDKDGYTDTNEVKHTQEKNTPATPATPNPPTTTSRPPSTGDGNNVELLIALLGMSTIITIYAMKRKKAKTN